MAKRINVRPYTKRNGTRVRGHTKRKPKSKWGMKQDDEEALKRIGFRSVKYVAPEVAVIEDMKDTEDDLKDLTGRRKAKRDKALKRLADRGLGYAVPEYATARDIKDTTEDMKVLMGEEKYQKASVRKKNKNK